jgi:hypothetical protein
MKIKKTLLLILTPLLIALYPISRVYLVNIDAIPLLHSFFAIISCSIVFSFALFTICLIYKSLEKGSLIVSLSLIMLYSINILYFYILVPISIQLNRITLFGLRIFRVSYILIPILLFIIYCLIKIHKANHINPFISKILFVTFLALHAVTLVQLSVKIQNNNQSIKEYDYLNATTKKHLLEKAKLAKTEWSLKNLPDIYFIILDSYSSNKQLQEVYSFNNSSFTNSLKKMGFVVFDDIMSNYECTKYSLPSILNMNYIPAQIDPLPTNHLWANNNVTFFLEQLGYKIVNHLKVDTFNSEVSLFTYKDKSITNYILQELKDFYFGSHSFFQTIISQNPILSSFVPKIFDQLSWQYSQTKTLEKLSSLEQISNIPQPKFVYAHFMCPHTPWVWDKGEIPLDIKKIEKAFERTLQTSYIYSIKFINKQILKIIDKIITKSKQPPIIILQSDHAFGGSFNYKKEKLDLVDEKTKLEIFYSYYFPNHTQKSTSKNISPVNNFRHILNYYFNAKLKLLKDEYFILTSEKPTFKNLITEY